MTPPEDIALALDGTELRPGEAGELSFRILADDEPVSEFDLEHERRMHLIVVRRDLSSFQHLHPTMAEDGTWRAAVTLPEAGAYRVFADFSHRGTSLTLGADLTVGGDADERPLPEEGFVAATGDGYEVHVGREPVKAGEHTQLTFTVIRDGEPVEVEPYLGAGGHLVSLRDGDLAFLHVHPLEAGGVPAIRFMAEFPSEGRYRLFLQFKHGGEVHTAAFTREVRR